MTEKERLSKLKELIAATTGALQDSRREGLLVEATLKDSEQRYASLQGRLAGLQEALALLKESEDAKAEKRREKAVQGKKDKEGKEEDPKKENHA